MWEQTGVACSVCLLPPHKLWHECCAQVVDDCPTCAPNQLNLHFLTFRCTCSCLCEHVPLPVRYTSATPLHEYTCTTCWLIFLQPLHCAWQPGQGQHHLPAGISCQRQLHVGRLARCPYLMRGCVSGSHVLTQWCAGCTCQVMSRTPVSYLPCTAVHDLPCESHRLSASRPGR